MTKQYTICNPYDGSDVGTYTFATPEDVQSAMETLKRGKKILAKLTAHERSQILYQLADLIESHCEELGTWVTKEMGKTIQDSRVEMQRSANTTRCSGDEAKRLSGEVLDADAYPPQRGKWGIVQRKPLGIVLAITPFNFPINLSMHKIGPAFASGNTIFFKPSPQNYFSSKLLVDLCYQAGMPEECIQLCMADIPELTSIIQSDDIQVISFTGSVPVAKIIARNAGPKKLLFELGGNDPLIVMPDGDLDKAVQAAINQRFATAGQRCTAAKRLFIHSEVYDAFKAKLLAATEKLVIGDPLKEETFVGPVVNTQAADTIERRVQDAIQGGAKLLCGGKREGNIIHPTILEDISPKAELCHDETFGPVIPLFKFNELDEVIELVNSTGFGLQSGVFTHDLRIIKRLYNELEVGALAVNDGPGFRAEHFPFGGVKNSGLGREGVRYTIEEMTFLKTLIM